MPKRKAKTTFRSSPATIGECHAGDWVKHPSLGWYRLGGTEKDVMRIARRGRMEAGELVEDNSRDAVTWFEREERIAGHRPAKKSVNEGEVRAGIDG